MFFTSGHISDEDDRSLLWFNSGFRFCHEANNIDYQEETKNNVILKFLMVVIHWNLRNIILILYELLMQLYHL